MKLGVFFTIALVLLLYSNQDSLAQEGNGRNCPVIDVSSPKLASTGRTLIYKAKIQGGDPSVTPTFTWTVSAGNITGGQGTPEVSVDPEGSNVLTVTVEVRGYPDSCPNKASYGWVADRPSPRKYDEYGNLKFSEERLRLNQFAMELQKEPKAKGYILVYAGRRSRRGSERAERAKKYLVENCSLQEGHIVVVDGGYREKFAVELFIVPDGAPPPKATSNVNP